MKRKHKAFIKLNIMSIFLIAVSFISATLAWFAYSGLSSVATEVNIKAWHIELSRDGKKETNDIVISLDNIYPGMETLNEVFNIKNLGDSDAQVNYKITSARILDDSNYKPDEISMTTQYVEDLLSHKYPFKINISLNKNYVRFDGDESLFEVSVSWPLDSDTDELDSEWGTKAYNFQKSEEAKDQPGYHIRPSIEIEISLTAEQYLDNDTSSDFDYHLGKSVIIDVVNNKRCETIAGSCINTYVIDADNKNGDETVTLLPNPLSDHPTNTYDEYHNIFTDMTSTWTVEKRYLMIEDILKVISKDVKDSKLIRPNYSDSIIGYLQDNTRLQNEVEKAINYNGHYIFKNDRFEFLASNECYWIKKDYKTNAFAVKKSSSDISKVFENPKSETCKVIPVIIASKQNITKTS